MDIDGIQRFVAAETDPDKSGSVSLDILNVGRLKARAFKAVLEDVAVNGAEVKINSIDKGWIETTYYGISVHGPQWVLLRYINAIQRLASE